MLTTATKRGGQSAMRALRPAGRLGRSMTEKSRPFSAYLKHRPVMNLDDIRGETMPSTFVAPSAAVVGDVKLMDHSCVWYGAVIRGDFNAVRLGAHVCVGDKAVINTVNRIGTGFAASVEVGSWVIIEPGATLTSCMIGDRCHVGAGAVVSEGSVLEDGAQIGAGTVVPPSRLVPRNELWAGNPAKFVRKLTEDDIQKVEDEAERMSDLGKVHADEFNPYGQAYLQAEALAS